MSQSLPAALRVGAMPSMDTMNIETAVLDPTTITQTSASWTLDRRGILDTGSAIQLALTCSATAATAGCVLPMRTGIFSVIERATLRIGTQQIATCDRCNQYSTLKRAFKNVEERIGKDHSTKGTMDGMEGCNIGAEPFYQPQNCAWTAADQKVGSIPNTIKLTADPATTPTFSVKLSELFPFMLSRTLPLFLIHEPVVLDIVFTQQVDPTGALGAPKGGAVACFPPTFAAGAGNDATIKVAASECKFLCDYLTFRDDTMQDIARQVMTPQGLLIPYVDTILVNHGYPAAGVGIAQSVTRDLGLAGQRVRSIVVAEKPTGEVAGGGGAGSGTRVNLLGDYYSASHHLPDSSNWRVNDRLVYSQPIARESQKASAVGSVFGTGTPRCLSAEYSADALTDAAGVVNSHSISTSTVEGTSAQVMEMSQHWTGVDISVGGRGVLIGQKPIIHERVIPRAAADVGAWGSAYWATVDRVMQLQGGRVTVTA